MYSHLGNHLRINLQWTICNVAVNQGIHCLNNEMNTFQNKPKHPAIFYDMVDFEYQIRFSNSMLLLYEQLRPQRRFIGWLSMWWELEYLNLMWVEWLCFVCFLCCIQSRHELLQKRFDELAVHQMRKWQYCLLVTWIKWHSERKVKPMYSKLSLMLIE